MADLLILLEGSQDIRRIRRFIRGRPASSCTIMSWKQEVEGAASQQGVSFRNLTEYVNPSAQSYSSQSEATLALIRAIGDCRIGGTAFKELTRINGISLWEIIWPLIMQLHMDSVVGYIDFMTYLLDAERPKRIVLAWKDCLFAKVVLAVSRHHRCDIVYVRTDGGLLAIIKRLIKPFAQSLARRLILFSKAGRPAKKSELAKNERSSYVGKSLFLSESKWQVRTFLPIMRIMREDTAYAAFLILKRRFITTEAFTKEGFSCYFAEEYLDRKVYTKTLDTQNSCMKTWRTISKSRRELLTVTYRDISIWQFIEPTIEYLIGNSYDPIGTDMELAGSIIEKERPDTIVFTEEIDVFPRCLLLSARLHKIPLIHIQYGNFPPFASYLSYSLADKILVSGESFKGALVTGGTPAHKVFVVGQPRFDHQAHGGASIDELKQRLGLRLDRKIALFSSTFYSEDLPSGGAYGGLTEREYYIWLREVYRAFKDLKNIQTIAKPHSNEMDPKEFHDRVINELGATDKIKVFSPYCEVSELIRVCDLIVSWDSTTVSEAITMGKDAVIVNLTGRPDRMPYVDRGAALGAYRTEDVLPVITKALEDGTAKEILREGRARYSKEYLCHNDGKSSERVAEAIKQACREYRKE